MLRARLFGPLAVEIDGRPVPVIAGLRPRSVLAWLLLYPGGHSRARLASLFWPDVLDTSARASLRNALWTIRTALDSAGGSGYLEAGREHVAIAPRLPRCVDAEEFERLAGLGEPDLLEEALGLAGTPLLTDLADDWVLDARDEYRERIADVALRLAADREDGGDLRGSVTWTRRALAHVPLRESVHRSLMKRLAAAGERAEALAAYERCMAMLAAEFAAVPSEPTRALAERLRAGQQITAERSPPHPRPALARSELPLIGRDGELAALRGAWERTRRNQGGVALVRGAAGLGKTRLVTELVAQAALDRGRCTVGTAFELDGAPPYGLWAEALHELVAEASVPPADAAWPADLARLCRSVERRWNRPAAPSPADPEQDRGWLFEAVAETLAWCSRDAPLLVVLEDIHLADHASLALLAYCGRRLTRLPVLVVATARPAIARQELTLAIDALARRDALTVEAVLEPLAPSETSHLVATTAPELDVETRGRVVHAAQGNPLLAREAARAAGAGSDLSHGFRSWVRAPLARLSGSARLLVDAVAVAGRAIEHGEAADLIGAQRLADALDVACREELLQARNRRVSFVHPLIREACDADLQPARRAWLHGRLADVLDTRPDRAVGEIGKHLLLAGRHAEARSYLVNAADRARSLGALDEAASLLSEAASAATGTPALEAELWLMLAETEAWRTRRECYDAAFERAVALLQGAGDWAGVAGAYVTRGRCMATVLCYPAESSAAHERALQLIDEHALHTPELRALGLAGLAWITAVSGDLPRCQQLIRQVAALPEIADDAVLAAELELARAGALLRERRFADSEQACVAAAALAASVGHTVLPTIALRQAAMTAGCRGDFAGVLELADRARRSWAGSRLAGQAVADRAYALARLGRQEEAMQAVREELALAARLGSADQEADAAFDAGSVALLAGRADDATERLAAVLADSAGSFPRALARLRCAEARLRSGDAEGANEELGRLPFEPVGPNDLPETFVPYAERLEGLIAAARGQRDLGLHRLTAAEAGWRRLLAVRPVEDYYAASLVDLTRSLIGGLVEPGLELATVLAERAELLAVLGQAAEARAAAQEAAELAGELGVGYRGALEDVACQEV